MAKKTSSRLPKRKGEYTYRGKTVAELQALDADEFIGMLPARERRTLKRGYTEGRKDVVQQLKDGKDNLRTHYRDIIIFPEMVGKNVEVYNGKSFVAFEIQPEMIGHRFGEFAPTRSRVSHGSAGVGATRSSKFVPLK
ncbi:MAG: small subunit ribosomal protein [Methanolobus sp.]|jgi:small subunit ribosomal protein S19|uniref:Small ribosomal subunit protein uS19 n=1 Tax=Methanolobus tindarius DSM 2278 TaxID=1090322 RepID=W9DSS4_METTI|nr:30S ribosomal protein S19 [Methanolobus tindarius]ETA68660.1 ribosomal protein S19/S15 [Methanolobus tindarius DSM 2278]MDK2940171.1 small subunit ribosomal protein [Methanolobus sp.]